MKKYLLLLSLVALFAAGCQNDTTTDVASGEDGVVLTVSLEPSRVSLGGKVGDTYLAYWNEGDRLVANGKLSEEVIINAENRSKATFKFSNGVLLSYPFNITYPYCSATTAEQSVVEFPTEQNYTEGSFEVGSAPMCGYTANMDDKIVLKHLASTLRFPVKTSLDNLVLDKVVITSTSGVKLSGEFAVDCKSATVTPTENTSNSITYNLPDNFVISKSTESVFYISLPAVSVGTCTIEFIEPSGEKMVANWAPSKPLSQGVVREFGTITYQPKANITLSAFENEEDEFEIFYENVCGYVRYSDGSPMAGVAVSDGFQITGTDENGYYELYNVTRDTWYIYCSLPSDVKVPIDELGRPCFFKKYVANTKQYDFTFEKLPNGPEDEFVILGLADPQPNSQSRVDRFKAQAVPEIKAYSQSLDVPCYGVVLGDIVYSTSSKNDEWLMPEMRSALSAHKTGVPMFAVMGNHDNCYFSEAHPLFPDERNSTYNLKIQRPFEECFGPINYSFNRGNVHFICMRNTQWNTNTNPGLNYTKNAWTDEQVEWLVHDLYFAYYSGIKTVVLCIHRPIFDNGELNDGTYRQDILGALNVLFEEAHVLSGHLHYRKCYDHKLNGLPNVYEQSWSSVAVVAYANGANINCDGAPTGYGVMTFRNGKMVKSIHKGYAYGMDDEKYQIRLHRGNDITGAEVSGTDSNKTKGYYQFGFNENTILANVFSSDPYTWSVEVWTYDEATGERVDKIGNMESLHTYHNKPAYEALVGDGTYENPRRPADEVISGREFWTVGVLLGHLGNKVEDRYHECHTLWRFQLPDEYANSRVMVVARDRWGNEYTQTEFQVGTDPGYAIYDPANNPKVK